MVKNRAVTKIPRIVQFSSFLVFSRFISSSSRPPSSPSSSFYGVFVTIHAFLFLYYHYHHDQHHRQRGHFFFFLFQPGFLRYFSYLALIVGGILCFYWPQIHFVAKDGFMRVFRFVVSLLL